MSEHEVPDTSDCSCKIGQDIEKYGIDRLNERLLDRREDGASLRDLESVVNRSILEAALRGADRDIVGDVAGVYERLTDDDASAGERTEVREWLTQAGIDPGELTGDFVSYQTVRTHLRECLDVATDRRTTLSLSDAKGTIEWARSRSEGIVERTLERLDGTDGFDAGSVEVGNIIRVTCTECGKSYPIETFLERNGCHCDTPE